MSLEKRSVGLPSRMEGGEGAGGSCGGRGAVEDSLHARAQRCYTHVPPVGSVMSCLLGQA